MMSENEFHENGLQKEDSQKVEKWLDEQDGSDRPFKHRAITPAALELFGDAAVMGMQSEQQQQLPHRCMTSLGGVRPRPQSLDLKPSSSPYSHQRHVLHQPHHLSSTRNGGALPTGHEVSGGGAFALPGRCHSSMDITRPVISSLHLHHSQPHPAVLPPKPRTSVMAQRSAKSFMGGNPYQAWASLSTCASPDPTANPPSLSPKHSGVGSLLHAAAAHRAGGTPVPASSASRSVTPSNGRSTPASKVRGSLDRAREILQGFGTGPSKDRRKQLAGEDGSSSSSSSSSKVADSVPAGSRASLDRSHAAAHRPTPTPVHPISATPDPSRHRNTESPSLGVSVSSLDVPAHGPMHGREQHRNDLSNAKQIHGGGQGSWGTTLPPAHSQGRRRSLEAISEAKDQEACSTLEAIQRDAELELEKLDRQPIASTHLNRPGSPTLYAREEQQAFPSEMQRQQQAWFTQHLEVQAKEGRGPAWEKPPTLGQEHRLQDPSPMHERISLEAGMGGCKDAAGHASAPYCINSRASIDFGTRAPQDETSYPSSVDSLEGSWPVGHGSRQGLGKGPSGASMHHPSAAAPPLAYDVSRAHLPHCGGLGQQRSPSDPQGQSSSSIFKDTSVVKTGTADHSMAQSSRCTSPSFLAEYDTRHSAPTATTIQKRNESGTPSPRPPPAFHSYPGSATPAPTPIPSAPPSETHKSAPLYPTPHPHSQLPMETVHSSMLFTPGGGAGMLKSQPVNTAARHSVHSQLDYDSEDGCSSISQTADTPISSSPYKATPFSPPYMPPFKSSRVHAHMPRGSLDLPRRTSPLTSPKAEGLKKQASAGSSGHASRKSSEGHTCKPSTLPPLHPPHGNIHSHSLHPGCPHAAPQRNSGFSSGFPRSSTGSCSSILAPQSSKGDIDSKQEPTAPPETMQSNAGVDSSQGVSFEPEDKPKEASAAQGLWSKLGARGGLRKMSSKNLAQTFLNHLERSNEDFLVEAARNRARSLTGDDDFSAQTTKDCRMASFEPLMPLSKAASRTFGIQPQEGDNQDSASDDDEDDDMLTPIERESMTARQQKLWAKARMTVRQVQIMKANPVAFNEAAAEKAEAEARAAAEHARRRFQDLCAMVCDARATGKFRNSLHHMQVNRPYFIPPLTNKRSVVSRATVSKKSENVWRLEDSIFMKRAKENDARNVFDTPQVVERQFEMDWARVSSKVRFRKMVTRQDQGLKDAAELERELDEVHDELQKRYTIIRAAFAYFSSFCGSTGSDTFLSMGLMEFHRMTRYCNIADPKTPGIRPSDIDTMFISTNFEEENNSNEEHDANDDNALVRFELLEIIVRMAIGKFIVPKVLSDVSDSVSHLFDNFIEPSLPAVAKIDTNDFRRDRLYCKEMEMEVVRHWDLLQAIFKLYKAKDRTKHFWVEHWIALLESTNILGGHTGIDKHCAKVLFAFAQSTVVDELRRRQRAISLTFFDFLEALARLSEVLCPPTPAELQAMANVKQPGTPADDVDGSSDVIPCSGEEVSEKPPSLTVAEYYKRIQNDSVLRAARADRVGLGREMHLSAQQRPLAESFSGMMEMMLSGLQDAWGGTKEVQTAARMQKMAQSISGGIELNT